MSDACKSCQQNLHTLFLCFFPCRGIYLALCGIKKAELSFLFQGKGFCGEGKAAVPVEQVSETRSAR